MYRQVKMIAFLLALLLTQARISAADSSESFPKGAARSPKASFFLIGGAADTTLSDFVKLAEELAGKQPNIAIITHASSTPAETGDDLQNSFEALGVKRTTVILPGSKVGIPKDCNAIYLCGGDQARLKRLLDEPFLGQLTTFEGLIGGSSAGAMIAAPEMITRGMDGGTIRAQALKIVDGLSFLPGCVVDTHAGQRSRDTRSLAALALIADAKLAIALDEDTAVYINKDGKARVYGQGHVRLFKRGEGFSSNIKETKKGLVANVKNVIMSALCEGDEFDIPAPTVKVDGDKGQSKPEKKS